MIERRMFIKQLSAFLMTICLPIQFLNFKKESEYIATKVICSTYKLKATWTLELQNDLANIYRLP
jgi:hypothetical protein